MCRIELLVVIVLAAGPLPAPADPLAAVVEVGDAGLTVAQAERRTAAGATPVDGLLDLPEAAAAVRSFMREPGLALEWTGIDWDEPDAAKWFARPLYTLVDRQAGQVRRGWSVDPPSGQVVGFTDAGAHPLVRRDGREPPTAAVLTPGELYRRCVAWLSAHAESFSPANFAPPAYVADPGARHLLTDLLYSEVFARPVRTVDGALVGTRTVFAVCADKRTGTVCEYEYHPTGSFEVPAATVDGAALERRALQHLRSAGYRFAKVWGTGFDVTVNASYPDSLIPTWRVSLQRVSHEEFEGAGIEYRGCPISYFKFHANTGELLEVVHDSYRPDVAFELTEAELDVFERLDAMVEPPPWRVVVMRRPVFLYPLPFEEDGHLYVRDTFAWLMGVRVYQEEDGTILLRGCEDARIPPTALRERHGVRYYPLEELAKASDARMAQQPDERLLVIQVRYPRPMGETRYLPAPGAAN